MSSGSIVNPSTINVYRDLDPIRVEVRQNWSDSWQTIAGLKPITASIPVGGQSTGSAQLEHHYGTVKQPENSSIASTARLNLDRWWIRLLSSPYSASDIFWQGRINNENINVHGNPLGTNDSGIQTFTAWDGTDLLRKRSVHASVFQGPTGSEENLQIMDWLIPVGVDRFRGNRGDVRVDDAFGDQDNYWYGLTGEDWLLKDFIEMLIIGYMNSHTTEPKWTLDLNDFESDVANVTTRNGLSPSSGDRAYIRSEKRTDEWNGSTWLEGVACSPLFQPVSWRPQGEVSTVWNIFNQVIQRHAGLNFVVYPTSDGFTLKIFSLANAGVTVGDAELQANPNTITIDAQSTVDGRRIGIERSQVDVFDTVRIIGPRIVSVTTFERGATPDSLKDGWLAAHETAYEADLTTNQESDRFRQHDQFLQVYQCFRVSEITTDYPSGSLPTCDADGELTTGGITQTRFRSTLPNLPLREAFDYSVDPPTNNSFDSERSPYLPPLVIIKDNAGNYIKAEDAGMSVAVLNDDLGFQLQNYLPHRVGVGRFTGNSDTQPEFDTRDILATLAWETDQRLILTRGATASPFNSAGGIKTLDYSRETVAWWMAPETVIGINGDGTLEKSPGTGVTLANDVAFLEQKAAGAEARYLQNRYRAKLSLAGFLPWSGLVGQILQITNASTEIANSKSVITGITWNFDNDFETQIRTGFFPIES